MSHFNPLFSNPTPAVLFATNWKIRAWHSKAFCIYDDISVSHYIKGGKKRLEITVLAYVRTRLYP